MILSSAVSAIKQLDCLQLCSPAARAGSGPVPGCCGGGQHFGETPWINQQLSIIGITSYLSLDLMIINQQASDVHRSVFCCLYRVCISLQNTEEPHLTVTVSIYSSHQPSQAQVELMCGQKLVMITTGTLAKWGQLNTAQQNMETRWY